MQDVHSGGSDDATAELGRLTQDNCELRAHLNHIINTQANLEQRLQRVEDSVVFRFLRWLGGKLLSVGVSVGGRDAPALSRVNGAGAVRDLNYWNWAQETSLLRRVIEAPSPALSDSRLITIFLGAHHPDQERLERMLDSLRSQTYPCWELFLCTEGEPLEWLGSVLARCCEGHSREVVAGESLPAAFKCALARARGEFVAVVNADAILEPDALGSWIAAAEDPGTVAVYSDWDHIDAKGYRHTPRFTPELSPELLSQTLYWGRCYFARTASLREMNWPDEASALPVEHDLALRLAAHSGSIHRVARMLWHMQQGAEEEKADFAAPRPVPAPASSVNGSGRLRGHAPVEARASIVICSRSSKQLRKCLKALLPTLDSRHEVILVAHQAGGDGPALEQVAASHSVRIVPYEGAFHFGVMNGRGVAASGAEVFCFLNDDVYPEAAGWLESMLAQATRPDIGVVGALLLYPNHTIQHAGVAVGGWHFPAHVGRLRVESPYWPWLRMTREVTAVTGACMTIRRSVWDELGGFDPRFPVNYNDIDFCLRAGARGYRVLVETQAVLVHEESTTRVAVVRPEEIRLFYERWGPVMNTPDKFFNPQLGHEIDSIELPAPWTLVR